MIIYGPETESYDVDLGPILLNDWYHSSYLDIVEQVMAPASEGLLPPVSNNNLINGKMNYPCSNTTVNCTPNAGVSKFQFQSGKKYRLRLINGGAEGIQKFSIDGYQLTVIANVSSNHKYKHVVRRVLINFRTLCPFNLTLQTLLPLALVNERTLS